MTIVNTNIAETINIDTNGTYDVARYTTANVSVGGSKYALLSRVKDDSNNDIGIVVGFHTDANNQKYAVVCLNKQYRTTTTKRWLTSDVSTVTDLPKYGNISVYTAKETATFNCDKLLAYATANEIHTYAVEECRQYSFVIDGVTYYGQLPNLVELLCIFMNRTTINTNDPSVSGTEIQLGVVYWSSNQQGGSAAWGVTVAGELRGDMMTNSKRIVPILEIPIQ